MKKIVFILCASICILTASATETESDNKESVTIELESSSMKLENNSNNIFFARMCCRRTVRNAEGESWTARRCVTHDDGHIAMGRACQLALEDAQQAQQQAHSYTLIKN